MSTLNSRILEAAKVISNYFPNKDIKNAEDVLNNVILSLGIDDTEIGLKVFNEITVDEFINCFKTIYRKIDNVFVKNTTSISKFDSNIVPEPRLKIVWRILKNDNVFEQKEMTLPHNDLSIITEILKQNKPIGQWSDTELLKQYGKDCTVQIEEELKTRSHGRPCIVFNEFDETIDIESSLLLLRQSRRLDTPSVFSVKDLIRKVYKIGDFPMNILYECPIHSNILLSGDFCEECGLKWENFEANKDKFVLLRLISQTTKIEPSTLRSYLTMSFNEISNLYPKILLHFNDLKEEEKLPTLKRRLSNTKSGDPFRSVHSSY